MTIFIKNSFCTKIFSRYWCRGRKEKSKRRKKRAHDLEKEVQVCEEKVMLALLITTCYSVNCYFSLIRWLPNERLTVSDDCIFCIKDWRVAASWLSYHDFFCPRFDLIAQGDFSTSPFFAESSLKNSTEPFFYKSKVSAKNGL